VVHIRETGEPDDDAERLEWFLYTILPAVSNTRQALDLIQHYKLRRCIEDWHRILKSGCDVELLARRSAEGLKRVVADTNSSTALRQSGLGCPEKILESDSSSQLIPEKRP